MIIGEIIEKKIQYQGNSPTLKEPCSTYRKHSYSSKKKSIKNNFSNRFLDKTFHSGSLQFEIFSLHIPFRRLISLFHVCRYASVYQFKNINLSSSFTLYVMLTIWFVIYHPQKNDEMSPEIKFLDTSNYKRWHIQVQIVCVCVYATEEWLIWNDISIHL